MLVIRGGLKMNIIERISKDLEVPGILVESALKNPFGDCKILEIPKRNGSGFRRVYHPSVKLKLVQTWLSTVVFSKLPVSPIASAYVKGKSIVDNARAHSRFRYSIRVDIENFFGSIKLEHLVLTLNRNERFIGDVYCLDGFFDVLRKSCFSRENYLLIGYTTSPIVSNAVMCDWDNELLSLLKKEFGGGERFCLTRYSDDFVFSTNEKGACRRFFRSFKAFCESRSSPSLRVNENKTRFMSSMHGAMITGLLVNKEGDVRVSRKYRDGVRLLLSLYKKGRLKSEDFEKLSGHLSFVSYADPKFFTSLSYRYYEEIDRLKHLSLGESVK